MPYGLVSKEQSKILNNTSVQMPACFVSSKSGAGVLCVPSEPPLITSLHWFAFTVESLKKLYSKTYIIFRINGAPVQNIQQNLHH